MIQAFCRALGATRGHIATSSWGRRCSWARLAAFWGVLSGILATAIYANIKGWSTLVLPEAVIGGIAAVLVIRGIAGLYPAMRAARLEPTKALQTT